MKKTALETVFGAWKNGDNLSNAVNYSGEKNGISYHPLVVYWLIAFVSFLSS